MSKIKKNYLNCEFEERNSETCRQFFAGGRVEPECGNTG